MKRLKEYAGLISAIALVISMFLNLYMSFENNKLQLEMKYYETTFNEKQKHYSSYMIGLKDCFYSTSRYKGINTEYYIQNIENEVYQLQPFIKSNDNFSEFKTMNQEFISLILDVDEYETDDFIDQYLVTRDSIQDTLFTLLFEDNNKPLVLAKKFSLSSFVKNEWANILTIVGILGTLLMVNYTRLQLQSSNKVSRATFWLELEKMFSKFDKIHCALRPGGEWNEEKEFDVNEWSEIEDYMGLFEHCELMIEDGVIDESRFKEIYLYRLQNILHNSEIVQSKLIHEQESWVNFISLLNRFNLEF